MLNTLSFAALTALIQPQDRLMGLGLPDGGHLTHGYYVSLLTLQAPTNYGRVPSIKFSVSGSNH